MSMVSCCAIALRWSRISTVGVVEDTAAFEGSEVSRSCTDN
ncbi:hypothetical protein [Scytonema sp. NUACC26]